MDVTDRVLRRLKLSDLKMLQAVVTCGSMARAARRLNISQPAVSKGIKTLEQTLGVRLLDRTPHGVELTIFGQAMLKGGVAVFDELQQSVRQIGYLSDPGSGQLHIGCTEPAATAFVPAIISRLSAQYPRIVFRVTSGDAASLIEHHLPERNIDLAIGAVPDSAASCEDIDCEVLFEDRYFVVAGVRNKWTRRRKIALRDLMNEPWVLPPADTTMGMHIARAFRAEGLEPPPIRVTSFSLPLSHSLLANGGFLTVLPVMMYRLAGHLNLRPLDTPFPEIPRAIALMTLKNRTLSPSAELFISCAREIAKDLGGD